MTEPSASISAADEDFHPFDPDDWSWNESWLVSWIDLDGGPAGFFRVGLLPNQGRAMLWSFVYAGGRWLGIEESRLDFDQFDLAHGVAYDQWALRFAARADAPLRAGRFTLGGTHLTRSGPGQGRYVPVEIDLEYAVAGAPVGMGMGTTDDRYPASRFEQSLRAVGSVAIDGEQTKVRAGAHRDHSWGPREWRLPFTLGDLQGGDRQLYFVGAPTYGIGTAYLREGSADLRHLQWVDPVIDFDDDARTIEPSTLHFESSDGERLGVTIEPAAPSFAFDMAHTCEQPEQWLYWRTLITGTVDGWDAPCRGWFETNRYGLG
jgi:hypothetical protein